MPLLALGIVGRHTAVAAWCYRCLWQL